MKQVFIKNGQVILEDVPSPSIDKNSVLVEVRYSLISTGTEIASLVSSGESIIHKIVEKPGQLKKAFDTVLSQGLSKTLDIIRNRVDAFQPVGYSCSGVVIGAGANVRTLKPGDRVACAGAMFRKAQWIRRQPRSARSPRRTLAA